MIKPNYIIVLNTLMEFPGERTIILPSGIRIGWHNNKLCHIMYSYENGKFEDEIWYEYDISLNSFVEACNKFTENDILDIVATTVLKKHKRP